MANDETRDLSLWPTDAAPDPRRADDHPTAHQGELGADRAPDQPAPSDPRAPEALDPRVHHQGADDPAPKDRAPHESGSPTGSSLRLASVDGRPVTGDPVVDAALTQLDQARPGDLDDVIARGEQVRAVLTERLSDLTDDHPRRAGGAGQPRA